MNFREGVEKDPGDQKGGGWEGQLKYKNRKRVELVSVPQD